MTEKYPYQKNWEDFRFRQALPFLSFFLWIFFILILAIVGLLAGAIAVTITRALGLFFFILTACLMIFGSYYFMVWKCPDCNDYYFIETRFDCLTKKSYRAKYCKHCRLPRYFGSTFFAEHWGSEKAKELAAARNPKS